MKESSNVYRLPIPSTLRRGEHESCPGCGEGFLYKKTVCAYCGRDEFKTHVQPNGKMHQVCSIYSCPGHNQLDPYQKVTKNRAQGRYCAPSCRIVMGRRGWWIFKRKVFCIEPSVHLHQHCDRCGWAGIVQPVGDIS